MEGVILVDDDGLPLRKRFSPPQTEEEIRLIINLRESNMKFKDMAKELGMSSTKIRGIYYKNKNPEGSLNSQM